MRRVQSALRCRLPTLARCLPRTPVGPLAPSPTACTLLSLLRASPKTHASRCLAAACGRRMQCLPHLHHAGSATAPTRCHVSQRPVLSTDCLLTTSACITENAKLRTFAIVRSSRVMPGAALAVAAFSTELTRLCCTAAHNPSDNACSLGSAVPIMPYITIHDAVMQGSSLQMLGYGYGNDLTSIRFTRKAALCRASLPRATPEKACCNACSACCGICLHQRRKEKVSWRMHAPLRMSGCITRHDPRIGWYSV
jgi:hypothetical protein